MSNKKLTTIFLILLIPSILFANEKLVFGLTGTIYKGDLVVFDKWKKLLEKKLKKRVELKFSRTYSEMMTMIKLGEVDIAYVCNSTYVKLHRQNQAKLLVIPVSNDKEVYYSYIISRKSSSFKKLNDFKGHLFAFTDSDSNSGAIAPTYKLLSNGFNPNTFFKKIIYTYEHGESIQAVFEEFVAGASVDSLVYEQFVKKFPNKAKKLKIVERIGPFTMSPIVANINIKNKTFTNIQKILTNMHTQKEGREILNSLSLNKLNLPKNKSYKDIENMIDYVEQHR